MNNTAQKGIKKYYWYGIFALIPIAGLVIGILLFRKGIILKDRVLCIVGTLGIVLTGVFFIGGLAYSKYSNVGKMRRVELARYSLNQVMRDVEFYKLQYGYYPNSLQELKFVDVTVFIMDPLSQKGIFSRKLDYLYYKKIDSSHYTLFSCGLDRIPHTPDDVYPFVPNSNSGRSGLDSFESKTRLLDSSWSKIFSDSHERIVLLQSIVSIQKNKNIIVDSLAILIEKYRKREYLYKKECSLDFVKLEFDLNKIYLEIMMHFKSDTLFEKNVKSPLQELRTNDKETNIDIDQYNNLTLRYNKYLSVFPNFIFGKRHGYGKRCYFTIKYGIENEDPIVKNKGLPEWAKGIDTI